MDIQWMILGCPVDIQRICCGVWVYFLIIIIFFSMCIYETQRTCHALPSLFCNACYLMNNLIYCLPDLNGNIFVDQILCIPNPVLVFVAI